MIKCKWKLMLGFVLSNWHSLLFAITSIAVGINQTVKPDLITSFKYLNIAFLLGGILKLVFTAVDHYFARRMSLTLLIFSWAFFAFSLLLMDAGNTIRIIAIAFTFVGVGISMRNEGSRDE